MEQSRDVWTSHEYANQQKEKIAFDESSILLTRNFLYLWNYIFCLLELENEIIRTILRNILENREYYI